MDFKTIKDKVIINIKKFGATIVSILKLPYAKTYIALSVFFFLTFLIITFPFDAIVRMGIQSIEKGFKSFTVESIDTQVFGPSELRNIYIVTHKNDEIKLRDLSLDIDLSPIKLLANKHVIGKTAISGGTYSTGDIKIFYNIRSDFDVKLDNKNSLKDGTINILIQNLKIKNINMQLPPQMMSLAIKIPIINIPRVSIQTDLKNKILTIKRCLISGSDLKGRISGNIRLSPTISFSRLNLKISIKKNSQILKTNETLKTIITALPQGDNIDITLKGTFANPRVMPLKGRSQINKNTSVMRPMTKR